MVYEMFAYRAPLPELGKYTISEDFATAMMVLILDNTPRVILELGSGISTVLASYCLEKIGSGRITSFDHLACYADQTTRLLKEHALEHVDVDVLFAPLRTYRIDNRCYDWYETEKFKPSGKIDMLIIDGPPRKTGKHARYPALPLL